MSRLGRMVTAAVFVVIPIGVVFNLFNHEWDLALWKVLYLGTYAMYLDADKRASELAIALAAYRRLVGRIYARNSP